MSTTRTSKKDRNFYSLDAENAVWFAGTENWRYAPTTIPSEFMPEKPQEWDAVFKTSNRCGTNLKGLRVAQGRENCLDNNNGTRFCSFQGDFGVGGGEGDQVITTKGGSHHVTYGGTVWSKGRRATVTVGAWSDQSYETSHTLDFSRLSRADGQPLTFILSRVNSPLMAALGRPRDIILPKGAKVLFWASIGDQIYWRAKWLAVKLHLIKGI